MELTKSILKDVRVAVGLSSDTADFDTELLLHINGAIGNLIQNGVVKPTVVTNESATWGDLQDTTKTAGNELFMFVPQYVSLSTKVIFDPPPPSAVEPMNRNIEQLLWRLKIAYETPYVEPTLLAE